MSSDFVARLAAIDTCAVSDALDRLGVKGAVTGLSPVSHGKRIAGAAVTVQLGPDTGQPAKRHLCTAAVDASGPGKVIVISHGRTDVAGWGGILSMGAARNAVEGVLIDGACRDVDESREFGLTVYAKAAVPVTARGRIQELDWDVPVDFAGVEVTPGDLVLADASGVVFVPLARAEEIVALAEHIAAREKLMLADVRRGKPMSEVMGTNYETMLEKAK